MTGDNWVWDNADISDEETIIRRVPMNPEHTTFDAELGITRPSPGAFRRAAAEGTSVHRVAVLDELGRSINSLYDPSKYSAVRFPVRAAREAGAGVLETEPTIEDEPDSDLRAAHAEIRPPEKPRNRPFWSGVVDSLIRASEWVEQTGRHAGSSASSVEAPVS